MIFKMTLKCTSTFSTPPLLNTRVIARLREAGALGTPAASSDARAPGPASCGADNLGGRRHLRLRYKQLVLEPLAARRLVADDPPAKRRRLLYKQPGISEAAR